MQGFADTFRALYRAVYSAIAGDAPASVRTWASFEDGHRAMLLGDAIATSAREGRWVHLSYSEDLEGSAA